jgi:hypothetical protein
MVVKFTTKNGFQCQGPPYTKEEEAQFYSDSIVGVYRGARTGQTSAVAEPSFRVTDTARGRPGNG